MLSYGPLSPCARRNKGSVGAEKSRDAPFPHAAEARANDGHEAPLLMRQDCEETRRITHLVAIAPKRWFRIDDFWKHGDCVKRTRVRRNSVESYV